MSDRDALVEKAARAAAIHDNYDGCFERIDEWEALEDWEREASERPSSDYEDAEWWRIRIRAALDAILPAHDAEVERVTAEKCARIAEAERDLHDAYLGSAVFADMRWEQGGIDAADTVARHIRSVFGLAPDEKGGE